MIFSLVVTTVLLFSETINEQIHALESASPQERVELMNSIKMQLISMNHEERMKTIGNLQKKLQVKHTQMNAETAHEHESQNDDRDEAKNEHQLEQHEMQEHMMNRSHGEGSGRRQSSSNHSASGQSEGHGGKGSSDNQHNRGK